MGYTMLNNEAIRKRDYAPESLEGAALSFIRELCEELRFDKSKAVSLSADNLDFNGTSLNANQIPFNMEKDIDRLCLENAVDRFLKSGRKEDAFDVYFCYLEMFVGDYQKTRRMIELLSEYEANGSGLLMKHRDHYSHSVYVFILGLAIFKSNEIYKKAYMDYYKISDEKAAAAHYLQYWGLSSLFHDIGYPFELPFEQVCSYFETAGEDRSKRPYVAYRGLESFTKLDKSLQRKISELFSDLDENHRVTTTDELFAHVLYGKLGKKYFFSESEMLDFLKRKPTEPNQFNHFMDHAYFSATVLFRKLFCDLKMELTGYHLDALTAIILHNSLYKFCVAYYKNPDCNIPFDMKLHPLAYMLMLCDELQCWDRIAYGRNSRRELHPMDARFELSKNTVKVTYIFDDAEKKKITDFEEKYTNWKEDRKGNCPKLKAYSSMYIQEKSGTGEVCAFQADIESIVDLTVLKLEVGTTTEGASGKRKGYLSDSNFTSLYNFAASLNARWAGRDLADDEIYDLFDKMSLEYKLSNINQAKSFSDYLKEIGAFYTARAVDFDTLDSFAAEELEKIGPLEHKRWLEEHYNMGWEYAGVDDIKGAVKNESEFKNVAEDAPEFKKELKKKRECLRKHWDLIPEYVYDGTEISMEKVLENYRRIGQEEQDKDTKPMELMIKLLKKFDGLRIYRL